MNSRAILNFIYNLNNKGIRIWAHDKNIKLFIPDGEKFSDIEKNFIKLNKNEILNILQENDAFSKEDAPIILQNNVSFPPLSFAQQRLWFIEKYEQGTNAYNIPIISKLSNSITLGTLERSIKSIVARHEILRTIIKEDNAGSHYQEVLDTDAHPLEILKVNCTSKEELDEYLKRDVSHIYDLSNEYPIRIRIYSIESSSNNKDKKKQNKDKKDQRDAVLTPTTNVLSIVIHHIAFDGWSADIFLNELKEYYRYYGEEEAGLTSQLNLPLLTVQYKDFALWQRSYLTGEVLDKQLSYWKSKLEGYEALHLPTDYTRPAEMDYEGRSIPFELERELSLRLREVAKSLGVSLYSLMLSCYYLMLGAYTGQNDIVIGCPVANRHYSQIEHLIGFFVNILALRVNLAANTGADTDNNTNINSSSSTHFTRTLRDFIKHVGSEILEAQLHQDLPFEKLVEGLNVPKDTSKHPIFQVMFSLQSFGSEARDDIKNGQSGQESVLALYTGEDSGSVYNNIAKFDLETFIDDGSSNGVLKGIFNYRVNLYKEDTIKRFINTYKEILSQVAKALSDDASKESFKIEDLTYLTKEEKDLILTTWNNTNVEYPSHKTIHQLFEEQVEKTPNNIAVVYEDQELTYQQLNERSNQLAHYLRSLGVGPDTLVAISVDRSLEMIIGLLAILKAGGAYVPLDPDYPQERLLFMLEDTNAPILITQSHLQVRFKEYVHTLLCLELDQECLYLSVTNQDVHEKQNDECNAETLQYVTNLSTTQPNHNPTSLTLPHHLAYVIYTSGSTGKPKGVLIENLSVSNHMLWMKEKYNFSFKDMILQRTAYSFDASIWELFMPLLSGAQLIIPVSEANKNLEILMDVILKNKITKLQFVPAILRVFSNNEKVNNLDTIEQIFIGGDILLTETIDNLSDTLKSKIINLYGPTETSIDATSYFYDSSKIDRKIIPIGRPISNTQIYILDAYLNPVPVGVRGEIYIGGAGLARGYLNRPDLTAEKFVPNPFVDQEALRKNLNKDPISLRLYRTGDLARYLPDGNIEFIGRIDDQVKIRGFRIELGEIESTLSHHGDVTQTVVIAREDELGHKQLVAYVIPQASILSTLETETVVTSSNQQEFSVLKGDILPALTEDLRNYLAQSLPDYMTPAFFVFMDKIPLTSNGKIDRKSLPAPDLSLRQTSDSYAAPRNEIESRLCSIWEEVLGLPSGNVGINDDFFKMGGDSIVSIQLVSKIRKQLSLGSNALNVRDIFSHRTIEKLYDNAIAKSIYNASKDSAIGAITEQGTLSGQVGLLPIQKWFFDSNFTAPHHWNQSFLVRTPELDIELIRASVQKLVEHHDAFRIQFNKINSNSNNNKKSNVHYAQYYDDKETSNIVTLKTLDIRTLTSKEKTKEFEKKLFNLLTSWQSNFSLEKGPLYSIGYIHGYRDGSARIFFALHHLIVDAVSWRILLEDLRELYTQVVKGESINTLTLDSKGTSYRQWAAVVADYADAHEDERSYWNNVVSDIEESGAILAEKVANNSRPCENETSSSTIAAYNLHACSVISLSKKLTTKLLKESHTAYNTEINDLLLSSLSLSLNEVLGSKVNHIILEGHGRHEDILESKDEHLYLDLSKIVGWFTTMYPVRLEVGRDDLGKVDVGSTIKYTKELLRYVPNKGIGFGSLLGYKDSLLPKISFNYLGQLDQSSNKRSISDTAFWNITGEPSGMPISNKNQDRNIININGAIINGELIFSIKSKLGVSITENLASILKKKLEEVVYHTTSLPRSYLTRSDIGNIISEYYLDKLQEKREVEAIYLANSLQQGFIYHYLNQGDVDDAYLVQIILQYKNKLDVNKLKKAWQFAQNKYPCLRLRFHWNEELVQIIDKKNEVKLDCRYIDLSENECIKEYKNCKMSPQELSQQEANQELRIKQIQEEDRKEIYKLEEGKLFRIYIIKQRDDLYTCIFSNHHAIVDGWSNPILFGYVHSTYQELIRGKVLDEARVTKDHVYLDAQKYLQENQKNNKEYWQNYLAKIENHLDLSGLLSDTGKSSLKNINTNILKNNITNHKKVEDPKSESLIIKDRLYQELKILSKKEGITLNVFLQYAWHKALKLYGSNNIHTASNITTVVGTIVSGRNIPINDIEDSVGLYINTLPLIVEHSNNTLSLIDDIKKLQTDVTEINTRSNVNLAKLQKNGARLFDTLFIFENYPVPTIQENQDSSASKNCNSKHTETKLNIEFKKAVEKLDYPLAVIAYETSQEQELTFTIKYAGELFDKEAIDRLLNITKEILSQVAKALSDDATKESFKIEDLSYLTEEERDLILTTWNSTDVPYPRNKATHQLFEEQVEKTPDKVALIYEDKQLNYGTLNNRSNQLSHLLRKEGVALDARIGISAPRGLELVIGMLAILKAGGAYVPLDPEYPEERLNYMLEDAGVDVLLTVRELSSLYQHYKGKIIYIDDYNYLTEPITTLALTVPPDALAYVIYTSGSTGKPKGVLIPHYAMLNRFQWMWSKYPFGESEVACHKTSLNFVDSIWELFGSLLKGVKLVLINSKIISDPELFCKCLNKNNITRLVVVPSLLNTLLSETPQEQTNLKHLKLCTVSGEVLPSTLITKYTNTLQKSSKLLNLYGSTEIGADATYYDVPLIDSQDKLSKNSIIGSPIDNINAYILDDHLTQVPIRAIGELFIGGAGLARGYLNRPGLTAEKFIANPISNKPGERLYRTGDLGRYLPDGNIEFIGRVDHQVKIRGFRIELGEIESAISSVSGVKQVIVLAREDEPGQKRLVVYVVPNNQILLDEEVEIKQQSLITDIRQECSKNLPDYMRPSQIMLLAEMPLTPNGKIDRKALPKPEGREGLEAYEPPQSSIESSLAYIWKELLQVERVGRNDNFFHLGGDSLLLVKMLYMIRKLLTIQVNIKDIYHTESLASLADIMSIAHIEDRQNDNIILDINKTAEKPMFLIHPIVGLAFPYVPLKKLLLKQHIIGINDPYFGRKNSGFSSISHMASHYIDVIKTSYDPNNCILGGWSFGGEVAYRMACQLKEDGGEINKLILFDSFTPNIYNLLVKDEDKPSDEKKSDYFFEQSMKRNNAIRKNENLPKFCGQVYLFKSIAYDPKLSEVNKDIISQQKDNGWGDYCENITVVNVNLTHEKMFEVENIHILTLELKNII